jgi:peptidoglycan hydrolase-like protein with peptidoglycan-binding domain
MTRPVLRAGSAGPAVRTLQGLLRLTPNGFFGASTGQAVRRFQTLHGLAVDGVVGPKTWAALGSMDTD